MKQRVLIVDDSETYREILASFLKNHFQVETASNSQEAEEIIRRVSVDLVLIDQRLREEKGTEVAKKLKAISPRTLFILMSIHAETFKGHVPSLFADCVMKGMTPEHWSATVEHVLLFSKIREQISSIEELARLSEEIEKIRRSFSGEWQEDDTEKIVGRWRRGGLPAAFNMYSLLLQGDGICNIAGATWAGTCGLGCRFCLHRHRSRGRKKLPRVKLDWRQIASQAAVGLQSVHAHGVWTGEITPVFNLTGLGETFLNWGNSLRAFEEIMKWGLDFRFIATTIGINKLLRIYRDRCRDFPNVRIYLSVNSFVKETRDWLMPATRGQNLRETLCLLNDIGRLTGNQQTASKILLPSINDTAEDRKRGAEMLADLEWVGLKVQPYVSPEKLFPTASLEEVIAHCQSWEEDGIKDARPRTIVGDPENFTGCGSTLEKCRKYYSEEQPEPNGLLPKRKEDK